MSVIVKPYEEALVREGKKGILKGNATEVA